MLSIELKIDSPLLIFDEPTGTREACIGKTPAEVWGLRRTSEGKCLMMCGADPWFASEEMTRSTRLGGAVTILEVRHSRVRLGIDAPPNVVFIRKDLYDRMKAEQEEKEREALAAATQGQQMEARQPEETQTPRAAPGARSSPVPGWISNLFGRRPKRG